MGSSHLLKLAYQLRYHYLAGWPALRWLATLPVFAAAVLVLRRPSTPTVWAGVVALLLLTVGLLRWHSWAAGKMYSVFRGQADLAPPAGVASRPSDKVQVHATGQFEVEGKTHFWADLLAYWRSFATREHAVMAIVHRSRFMLLARTPNETTGMWYIFFGPDMVCSVTPGGLVYGASQRPALQVCYQPPAPEPPKRRFFGLVRQAPPGRVCVYLAFEDDEARRQVWADLLAR